MSNLSTEKLSVPSGLNQAIALLKAGQCVALPTETVYGLAADASQPEAVAKIFAAKQRPTNHPLIVHIASAANMTDWAVDIPDLAYTLANAFWPGPLSLLLNKAPHVPDCTTGGKDSIVLRAPAHPVFHEVLERTGMGLAAPSANLYKTISPTSADHVLRSLGGRIPAVVDGGDSNKGIESTIIDIRDDKITLLRPGPISAKDIELMTGLRVNVPEGTNIAVPGNVKQHYQPETPASLTSSEAIKAALVDTRDIGVIAYSQEVRETVKNTPFHVILPGDHEGYAKGLYAALHSLDMSNCREIWIEAIPQQADWLAVNDRLTRAVAK